MSVEKLHHHERFIQLSGLALLLSPFTNFFLSVLNTQSVYSKWTPAALGQIAASISWFHWALWSLSFTIGLMMLKGRRSSWIGVLALLGIFIVVNLFQLPRELEKGRKFLPFLSLFLNCGVFVMLYWVEFKQVAPLLIKKAVPVPTPAKADPFEPLGLAKPVESTASAAPADPAISFAPVTPFNPPRFAGAAEQPTDFREFAVATGPEVEIPSLINTVIEFEGLGPWATIVEMNEKEVCVESFQTPPPEIFKQTVDLVLNEQHVLVLRAHSHNGNKYFFRYEGIFENQIFHKIG
jgi:hypothetical protein